MDRVIVYAQRGGYTTYEVAKWVVNNGILFLTLPSGKSVHYPIVNVACYEVESIPEPQPEPEPEPQDETPEEARELTDIFGQPIHPEALKAEDTSLEGGPNVHGNLDDDRLR